MIHKGAPHSEVQRSNAAKEKRRATKARAENSINTPPTLQTCGRGFHARMRGVQKTHHWMFLNAVWHGHIRILIDEQQHNVHEDDYDDGYDDNEFLHLKLN